MQRIMHDEASSRIDEQQLDGFSLRSEISTVHKQVISTSIANNIDCNQKYCFLKSLLFRYDTTQM